MHRWTSAGAFGVMLAVPVIHAQTSVGPRFDAASIRAHVDDGSTNSGFSDNPSSVRMGNLSLRALVRMAYGVLDAQLEAPGWLADVSFDIVAKPPDGYDSSQLPALVRNLLADRFKLAVHREPKEVGGFALRVVNGTSRLSVSTDRSFLTARPGLISGKGRSIAELVALVAQTVGAPVVDQTGMTGRYDLQIAWSPTSAGEPTDAGVPLVTALREQAGLRLEPARVSVDVVVVDGIARTPTEN
jgi:uncharacterized protein (TIGR03435 family)